jgi:uncharacterized protein (TIGR03382 family)
LLSEDNWRNAGFRCLNRVSGGKLKSLHSLSGWLGQSLFCIGAALFALSPSVASAEVWAYTDYAPAGPLQGWTGGLGMDFNVNQSIYVTSLGAFNPSGNGLFHNNVRVGIFDLAGTLQGSSVTFASNTLYSLVLGSYDVYQGITPVLLNPGSYSVVALGYSSADPNGNLGNGSSPPSLMNDGGGIISFTGGSRFNYDSVTLQLPNQGDGGPVNRYNAGTFGFTTSGPGTFESATPEPGTFVLSVGVLAFAGAIRRRRSSR